MAFQGPEGPEKALKPQNHSKKDAPSGRWGGPKKSLKLLKIILPSHGPSGPYKALRGLIRPLRDYKALRGLIRLLRAVYGP